ncbi:alpha/beta fold hydrolase [Candidatus Neomarinimicrobiota bacterium]
MSTIRLILYTNLVLVTLACAGFSPRMSGKAAQPEGFIEVDGGQLYYEVAGAGETILMVHDGLLHRETWNLQFDDLARDHRVIRYDRRGYGKSPAPEEPFSLVEDLDAVFRTLGVEQAMLMGMSAGARLAVDYTLAYPGKVSSLILVGPVVSGMDFTNHFIDRGGRVTQEITSDRAIWRNYYVQDDPYTITPGHDTARELAQKLLDANPHNFAAVNNLLARQPVQPALGRLSEIAVPTLIVVGEHDIADVHAHAGALETGILGAQRIIIRDAAHLIPLDQPEPFLAAVRDFMAGGEFTFILRTQGVAEAVDYFHARHKQNPEVTFFEEAALNGAGYSYLFQEKLEEAIALFKLNVEAYPESFNAYDSLGEALLAAGDREGAEANYRKSLELNPGNDNAVQVLKSMGVKIGD